MPQYTYAARNGGFLPQFRSTLLVAAGSNQFSDHGSPTETLSHALNLLRRDGQMIRKLSRFFETPCFPEGAGPDFVNAVFEMEVQGTPKAVLDLLHAVEAELGRQRQTRWGQRTLDLDLLACGQQVLPDRATVRRWMDLPLERQTQSSPDDLILPHPRLHERAFVLVPLLEVAPQWVHPLIGRTVRQMVQALPKSDVRAVKPLVLPPENN